MIIAGIFISSIFISIVKANWIVFQRSPLNVSADNIGNGSFSETLVINNENFVTDQNSREQTTTETVNVERYLENLGDVDHVYESTTEMSIDDIDGNERSKSMDNDEEENLNPDTSEPTDPPLILDIPSSTISRPTTLQQSTTKQQQSTTTTSQSSTSQSSTTSQLSSKKPTTVGPSLPTPNPCLITDSRQCQITCSNTNSTELSDALNRLISGVDLMDYPECPFADIKLKLVNVRFSDSGLTNSWLSNIGTNIIELRIEKPQAFTLIKENSFNSVEFSTMEILSIEGGGSSNLFLESENIFIGATSLTSVIFSDFEKISLEPDIFSLLSATLTYLEISKLSKPSNYFFPNSLTILLKDSNLQNIESLNLQHNNFSSISLSKHIFESSKDSIKIINFADSKVYNLTSDTFADCKQLKELHLENNIIRELPVGIFDDLENLESLFLQNNQLTTIPEKLFDTQLSSEKLTFIDLSGNPWFCDSQIFYLKNFLLTTKSEVTINNCTGPPSLSGRPIQGLWCNVDSCTINCEFTAKRELLAELEDLDMSNCTEVELNLKYHTFNEETLPEQWLSQLEYSIHKLTIAHSNIKSIKNGTFRSPIFENLRELVIDHNNETDLVIETDGLAGLNSIEILKIERSAGLSLSTEYNILEPIKDTLKELSVSYLTEPFDPRLLFEHTELKNLETLHLTGNNFDYIEFTSTTFEGVHEHLEQLFIVDSKVTNITADAFSGFKNLKTINLAGNDIESLDGQFFGTDPDKKLVSINLSNLKLKNLEVDTFNGCKQLKKLSLGQNSIEILNAGIFDDLVDLEFLELQDNSLKNIPENLFKIQLESENLKFINFTNNPWNCDSKIIHLKQFLINTKAEILINGCSNPNHNGQDIKDLWCRQDECTLICKKTDDQTLPVALQIYEMPNCETPTFHLIAHSFINSTINNNSLSNLKFNVHKMVFEEAEIESIQNNAFKLNVFEELKELKISQITKYSCYINEYGLSGLKSIEVIVIENLMGLTTFTSYSIFSVIQNTIREITVNGIKTAIDVSKMFNKPNFTNLQVLRLTGNIFIDELTTSTFRGAHETLEEIYLSNTTNMTAAPDAFSMFQNLKIVDFAGCALRSLDGNFFGDLDEKKLISINLSMTKLESLENNTFSGCMQLKSLDLSHNFINKINPGTFDDLKNLESLYLQNNSLRSIPKDLLKVQLEADKLEFVDFSNNLWHCDVSIIHLKHFLEFTKAEISINNCTGPELVLNRVIKDLWCKVEECTIFCEGTDDNLAVVLDYPYDLNCDYIELQLKSHQPKGLVISENFLSNLQYGIQKLSIDRSHIEQMANNVFNSKVFENLKIFIMTRNVKSFFIESNSFNGLGAIEYFEIDESPKIYWLSAANVLAPIRTSIKEIRLTNIKEDFNPGAIFDQTLFEKLKILHLNGNDFKILNESYFAGTHETLEELYLWNSKISTLNSNTFSGFKNLKLIDLGDNNITSLEPSHFGNLLNDEDFKIQISGNPWDCTCKIEFLLNLIADEENVTCANPEELSGKDIFELEEICHMPTTTTEDPTTITQLPTTSTQLPTTTTKILTTTTKKPITTEEPSTTTEELTTKEITTEKPTTIEEPKITETKSETQYETDDTTTLSTEIPSEISTTPTIPLSSSTLTIQNITTTSTTIPPSSSSTTSSTLLETTTSSTLLETTTSSTLLETTTIEPSEPPVTTEDPEPPVTTEDPENTTEPTENTTISKSTTQAIPYTGSTTTSPRSLYTPSYITCFDPDNVEVTSQAPFKFNFQSQNMPSNLQIPLQRPYYEFKSIKTTGGTQNEVSVEISDFYSGTILLYYPATDDPFAPDKNSDERYSIRCLTVSKTLIIVKNLAPNVIYNFCLIINVSSYQMPGISPFQCRSYQIAVGKPWLYEEQKTVILTSLSLLIIMALIIGIILTYCLIRQIPTLIKGSKRVVLVNNRAREVMILPRSSTQSSNQSVSSSCRKESVSPIYNEAPTYLTPLPRQSFDQRPPFHRSSSDTSLKSYVSVSRLPPRFSQVYQRDDFDSTCLKHHSSFPYCPPTAPYPPVSEIPPPLPRRSIVSNSSSTQHSCASTAELGRTMSRAHNSTYRRHPRPIEIEQENHYNVII